MNKVKDILAFKTLLLIILFIGLFALFSNLSFFIISKFNLRKLTIHNICNKTSSFIDISNNRLIGIVVIQIMILFIILLYLKITLGSINSQTLSLFRMSKEYSDSSIHVPVWYNYLTNFSQFASFFSMFILINNHFSSVKNYQNKYLLALSSVLFIPLCILSSSRYSIIVFLFYSLFIYVFFAKQLKRRTSKSLTYACILIILLISLFRIIGRVIGRGNNGLLLYLGGSITSFNDYIKHPYNYISMNGNKLFGLNTFNNVFNGLHKLHLMGPVPASNIGNQFSSINGYPIGNVYTALRPFYEDFGSIGVVLFAIILGIIFGLLYYKIKSISIHGASILLIVYGFMSGMLILAPYAESICSTFLSFGFLIELFMLYVLKVYYSYK